MFVYRIYELENAGKVANRWDFTVEIDAEDAIITARKLAVDLRGGALARHQPPWHF
jgi:hypothetical protein